MIDFKPITPESKAIYEEYLPDGYERGCEFSFANLYLWGRQSMAEHEGNILLLAELGGRTVYPFPVGRGDKKAAIDAILADARERGIPCLITGVGAEAKSTLDSLYPGGFRYECNRDHFDYVYSIDDLADLRGRKFHRKRNHYNRFKEVYAGYTVKPLAEEDLPAVRDFAEDWYAQRCKESPESNFDGEKRALWGAIEGYGALEMEGLALLYNGEMLAVTLGSRLSEDTFDVHFEKARTDADGAYAAINCEFAGYLRSKYPALRYLNREEDMGLAGLRRAKESYNPHHMIEKCRACALPRKHGGEEA